MIALARPRRRRYAHPNMQTYLDIPGASGKLAACLHRPLSSIPTPVVICCHGLTGTRIGTAYRLVTIGRRLAEAGIACLRFDFGGCGESEGEFQNVTAESLLEDLRAVVRTVEGMQGTDPARIGIIASSFGAYTASRAAASIAGLRCLVFLAPVSDPAELINRDMTPEAWAFLRKAGWIEHFGQRMGAAFIDTIPNQSVPTLLAKTPRPLLIFHGRGDKHVPPAQGEAYASASRKTGVETQLDLLDADDHGMRNVKSTDAIVSGAVDWMKKYL